MLGGLKSLLQLLLARMSSAQWAAPCLWIPTTASRALPLNSYHTRLSFGVQFLRTSFRSLVFVRALRTQRWSSPLAALLSVAPGEHTQCLVCPRWPPAEGLGTHCQFFFPLAVPLSLWDLSSLTRDWNRSAVKAWSPNHRTTRELPGFLSLFHHLLIMWFHFLKLSVLKCTIKMIMVIYTF